MRPWRCRSGSLPIPGRHESPPPPPHGPCPHSAVVLYGGDRPSLTPGGNFVLDCHVHHFGRWRKTYTPAVAFEGVGHRIAHNHFHDGPHAAVLFAGNNHVIEYNHIRHTNLETEDTGAVYTGGRDWISSRDRDSLQLLPRHARLWQEGRPVGLSLFCVGRLPGRQYRWG